MILNKAFEQDFSREITHRPIDNIPKSIIKENYICTNNTEIEQWWGCRRKFTIKCVKGDNSYSLYYRRGNILKPCIDDCGRYLIHLTQDYQGYLSLYHTIFVKCDDNATYSIIFESDLSSIEDNPLFNIVPGKVYTYLYNCCKRDLYKVKYLSEKKAYKKLLACEMYCKYSEVHQKILDNSIVFPVKNLFLATEQHRGKMILQGDGRYISETTNLKNIQLTVEDINHKYWAIRPNGNKINLCINIHIESDVSNVNYSFHLREMITTISGNDVRDVDGKICYSEHDSKIGTFRCIIENTKINNLSFEIINKNISVEFPVCYYNFSITEA